ncbi:unnamed protein product, partial [Ixodes hexagonus]
QEDCNVIVVDWSGGSTQLYNRGAANTALVGREISLLTQHLMDRYRLTLRPADVHIIGFSFGAQVAGFFGRNFKRSSGKRIWRITALDPAGPLFNDSDVYVSKKDATFVDVIHTSGGYGIGFMELGLLRPVGHVDFYPNGAKNQPGCSINVACDHLRAPLLFLESIRNKRCSFKSTPCSEILAVYSREKCGGHGHPGEMGYYSFLSPGRGIQLLKTNGRPEFCIRNK